jgi:anti-sigma B factor antagonist
VVCPPSELDIANADRLRDCCQAAIEACGPWVVVDLAGTQFLDSTALNVFVQVGKQAESEGGWLRLAAGDSPTVRKVLEITLLDAYFGNYPSVERAILRRVDMTRPRRLEDRHEAT